MKRLLAALLLQLSGTLQLSSSEAPAGRRLHGSSESACGDGAHVEGVLRCTHGQNCSALLQAAIDAAAAENGAGTLCIGGTWPVQPIALRSNLRLHLTSDATIIAQRGAFHGGADHLIDVLGVQNVSIVGSVGGGSRLVMRKSDYVDTTLYSHSEGRHALYIMESRHVRVSDLEIMEPGGDSVYLGGSIGGGPATDVELLRVVSRNAYRNGLSITGARDVVVRSCSTLQARPRRQGSISSRTSRPIGSTTLASSTCRAVGIAEVASAWRSASCLAKQSSVLATTRPSVSARRTRPRSLLQ